MVYFYKLVKEFKMLRMHMKHCMFSHNKTETVLLVCTAFVNRLNLKLLCPPVMYLGSHEGEARGAKLSHPLDYHVVAQWKNVWKKLSQGGPWPNVLSSTQLNLGTSRRQY